MLNRTTRQSFQSLIAGVAILGAASAVQAEVIASYDSGVTAAMGVGGAADPATQGWTFAGPLTNGEMNSAGAHAYGADGGWRTVDIWASGGQVSLYIRDITASDIQAIDDGGGWVYKATVSMDSGYWPDPSFGATDNPTQFLPPNPATAQFNSSMWLEIAGEHRYWLTLTNDADGNLLVNDRVNVHQITTEGNNIGFDNFFDLTLTYDADTGATLNANGNDFNISPAATGAGVTLSRVIFGNVVSSTFGSTVWNEVEVTAVPEPGSLALLAAGGVMMIRRRRRA